MSWGALLRPDILIFMIPIVAIVVWGVVQIVRMVIEHRERVAWIEQGLDPDEPHAPFSEYDEKTSCGPSSGAPS